MFSCFGKLFSFAITGLMSTHGCICTVPGRIFMEIVTGNHRFSKKYVDNIFLCEKYYLLLWLEKDTTCGNSNSTKQDDKGR